MQKTHTKNHNGAYIIAVSTLSSMYKVAKKKTPSAPERLRVPEDESSALRPRLLGAYFSFNIMIRCPKNG